MCAWVSGHVDELVGVKGKAWGRGEREGEMSCTWIAMETGADQSMESHQNIRLLFTAEMMN